MIRRLAALAVTTGILASAGSCGLIEPCTGGSQTLYFDPGVADLWVGDKHLYRATLFDTDCERVIASSSETPSAFAFTSSDANVARIEPSGALTAVGSGTATIGVTYGGHRAQMNALVTVPIASVRIVTIPATVARGDGVTAQVEALDAAGDVIANARVWGFQVMNRSGQTVRFITYEVGQPSEYRFAAPFSGQYELTAEFNQTLRPRIAKTHTFTVP